MKEKDPHQDPFPWDFKAPMMKRWSLKTHKQLGSKTAVQFSKPAN